MYCINCATQITESTRFRPACGSEINQASQVPRSAGLRGFSTRIGAPAFAGYIKKTNRRSSVFSAISAVCAVIGFYIAGEDAERMNNPLSFMIGAGIGGMFVVIAPFRHAAGNAAAHGTARWRIKGSKKPS